MKYTLVYVPEGNKPDDTSDVFDTSDIIGDDDTSSHLIDQYTDIVKGISNTTTVCEFTSSSKIETRSYVILLMAIWKYSLQ